MVVLASYHYISDELFEWGINHIHAVVKDPFIDNFRMARVWKSSDCRRYQREKNNGCCGFYDDIVTAPDGNKYLIGCNYGH